jgi:hypothetical protein
MINCDGCGQLTIYAYRVVDREDNGQYNICPKCYTIYENSLTPIKEFCKMNNPDSLFPNELSTAFEVPGKTLKLKVKQGTLVEDAFKHALVYLNSQTMYTRIEFKHGTNYIVVAKLKEE